MKNIKMPEDVIKQEQIQKANDEITKLRKLGEIEELIKNNEIEIEYEGTTYKVIKPTFSQKQDAWKKKIDKYVELLKNENNVLEADLRILYKKRGIDIDEMDKRMLTLQMKKDDLMLKLGEALKNKAPDNELEIYKKEIEVLLDEIQNISIKKTLLFESTIENQVLMYIYTYLAYLITYKKVIGKDLGEGNKEADTWIRLWNTWEEYKNASEALINKISYYAAFIIGIDYQQ